MKTSPADGKDAVLALAWNYDPIVAQNFLCSLRRTTFKGDVILFVSDNEKQETLDVMKSFNATVKQSGFRDNIRISGREEQIDACAEGGYRYCLLTDFRDVYFQANPFERYPEGHDLVFVHEAGTIGNTESNHKWVQKCLKTSRKYKHPAEYYPTDQSIWDKTVICSGTIVGTPKGLKAWKAAIPPAQQKLPHCTGGWTDQGLTNIILHWAQTEPEKAPELKNVNIHFEEQGAGG